MRLRAEMVQNPPSNAMRVLKGVRLSTARELLNGTNRGKGAFVGRDDAKSSTQCEARPERRRPANGAGIFEQRKPLQRRVCGPKRCKTVQEREACPERRKAVNSAGAFERRKPRQGCVCGLKYKTLQERKACLEMV